MMSICGIYDTPEQMSSEVFCIQNTTSPHLSYWHIPLSYKGRENRKSGIMTVHIGVKYIIVVIYRLIGPGMNKVLPEVPSSSPSTPTAPINTMANAEWTSKNEYTLYK